MLAFILVEFGVIMLIFVFIPQLFLVKQVLTPFPSGKFFYILIFAVLLQQTVVDQGFFGVTSFFYYFLIPIVAVNFSYTQNEIHFLSKR